MALKEMFDEQYVADLGQALRDVWPAFDAGALAARVLDDAWEGRELMDRMRHITSVLAGLLPADYRTALDILRRAAPALSHYGFQNILFSDYVAAHGLEDWDVSIPALEQFTQMISAEFAVRPFIVRDQARMMAQMLVWARHDSADVRRLASEGCRPRLPWGIRLPALQADPSPILPILDILKSDESDSVRRSVANNLNDIAKDNPHVVLDVLHRWQAAADTNVDWIVKHALRTLLKDGHPGALELLGYSSPEIAVHNLSVEPSSIPMGGEITFSFDVESLAAEPQELMIDFVLHLARARGRRTPKVFKLSTRTLDLGETIHVSKTFSFEPVTTRKYYPGEHLIEPQINGVTYGAIAFAVTP
ncbi:MAG TPA: DNA alkylation repair protein [Anaerolineae bacterium]|nr:DNA alkylation repair protein [Anaerolineae bacterium]